MKKNLFLSAALLFGATSLLNAQFRMDKDYPTAGIKVITDTLNAKRYVTVDFNTDKALQLPSVGTAQKAQTQRGVQVKVYNELGDNVSGVDGKAENFGSNGNLIHISNPDSILAFYSVADAAPWSTAHNFWKPNACFFDVDGSDLTNQAFGMYSGIYKKVDYRFQFNFAGFSVLSDIEFDIATLDAGNTGKTAAYKLMVSIGSDKTSIVEGDGKTPDYTVADFYTTGESKHVKLAEAIGADPSIFTNKKVYITLYTNGTGDYIQHGKYDPVIVFDNFTVTHALSSWLEPATGIIANEEVNNISAPVENITLEGDDAIFPVYLKASGRVGSLTIVNDVASEEHASKDFSFLPSLGVKAKGADGKYTVDLAYDYTPDTQNGEGAWSKEQISISELPAGGVDDICVYVKYTKKATDVEGKIITDKLEINCGVRIWYTFAGKLVMSPNSLDAASAESLDIYTEAGKIYVKQANANVAVYQASGVLVKAVSADVAEKGVYVDAGVYVVNVDGQTKKVIVK